MAAECANPQFLAIAREWHETARERNSKGVTTYKRAYESLRDCPLVLEHPSQCIALQGWGAGLCGRLTKEYQKYCDEQGIPMPPMPHKRKKGKATAEGEEGNLGEGEDDPEPAPKKKKKTKLYVPTLRSGAYAIVLALSTLSEDHAGLPKADVIRIAQPHCDSNFSVPSDPTKFYTAWNSMKTLTEKDLVSEKGRPTKRYALTEEGWEVAKRIQKTHDPSLGRMDNFVSSRSQAPAGDDDDFYGLPSVEDGNGPSRGPSERPGTRPSEHEEDVVPQGQHISDESSLPSFTPITLEPGSFTVQLILDSREIRAKEDRDYMARELSHRRGVKPIVRALDLGDALWVAKMYDPNLLSRRGAEGDEILLDYIVERKRLDDLVSSIKDGRFHEQKFRLKRSGIKNVVYLIEHINVNDTFDKYREAIETAIASTQVVNGYFIKKTLKMDETIAYLASMTKLLKERYENKPLHLIPTKVLTTGNYLPLLEYLGKKEPATKYHITYKAFASISSKSEGLTLRDVYLKMLMCTRGVTGEKAIEIQKRWKTPIEFIEAYRKAEEGAGTEETKKKKIALVSSQMGNLVGRKKIQKAVSSKIAEVWGGVEI